MAEDCKVLRAVFERKGDCQRVAVAAAEHTVFGNILKRSALLQGREPVVDVRFVRNKHLLQWCLQRCYFMSVLKKTVS